MKKIGIKGYIGIGVVVIILFIIFGGIGTYNSLQTLDVKVDSEWAQVENQLQRRYDLIPNLVETVKGYASHEEETLTAVMNARNNYQSGGSVQEAAEYEAGLNSALEKLSVVVEAYPDLKANESFQNLMTQLEGTENRIAVARMDYNDAVETLNARIRTFPTSIIANMIGIEARDYFKSVEGSEAAPIVNFGD